MQVLRPRSRPAESDIAGLGAYETYVSMVIDSHGANLISVPRWVWTRGSQLWVILPPHQGTLGNVWRCFLVVTTRVVLLASSG